MTPNAKEFQRDDSKPALCAQTHPLWALSARPLRVALGSGQPLAAPLPGKVPRKPPCTRERCPIVTHRWLGARLPSCTQQGARAAPTAPPEMLLGWTRVVLLAMDPGAGIPI